LTVSASESCSRRLSSAWSCFSLAALRLLIVCRMMVK
jgi:hypothetical protein